QATGTRVPLHLPLRQATVAMRLTVTNGATPDSEQLGLFPNEVFRIVSAGSSPLKGAPFLVTPMSVMLPPLTSVGCPVRGQVGPGSFSPKSSTVPDLKAKAGAHGAAVTAPQ